MINFEKTRLEYILRKENELAITEKKIKTVTDCSSKNNSYQEAIKNINSIISNLNLPPGSICQNYNDDENKKTINSIKSIILNDNLPNTNNNINNNTNNNIELDKIISENNVNIYHEVPAEYVRSEI